MKRTRQFQPQGGTPWSGAASYQSQNEEPPHIQMTRRAKEEARRQQTLSKGGVTLKWITIAMCILLLLALWYFSHTN